MYSKTITVKAKNTILVIVENAQNFFDMAYEISKMKYFEDIDNSEIHKQIYEKFKQSSNLI